MTSVCEPPNMILSAQQILELPATMRHLPQYGTACPNNILFLKQRPIIPPGRNIVRDDCKSHHCQWWWSLPVTNNCWRSVILLKHLGMSSITAPFQMCCAPTNIVPQYIAPSGNHNGETNCPVEQPVRANLPRFCLPERFRVFCLLPDSTIPNLSTICLK